MLRLVAKVPFTSSCFNLLSQPGQHSPKESGIIEQQNHANAPSFCEEFRVTRSIAWLVTVGHVLNSYLLSNRKYIMKRWSCWRPVLVGAVLCNRV